MLGEPDDGREHRLTAALDYRETDFTQAGVPSPGVDPNRAASYDNTGLAGEYVGKVLDDLTWTVSARYDDFSDFDSIGTWRVAGSHRVYDNFRFRGSVGTGSKTPTFTERFAIFDFFIGNPDLKPETSRGWEFGFDTDWSGGAYDFSLVYFASELRDEIDSFVYVPELFAFTAQNKDSDSERTGFEATFNARPVAGLTLGASYTYTDANEENAAGETVREVRRPRHMGSFMANYRFSDERANLNLNVNYTGRQYDIFFDPVSFVGEQVELKSYTVTDLAGSWQLTRSLELVARITNLTDEDYEEVLGFSRPGRAYYGGLRGRFDF